MLRSGGKRKREEFVLSVVTMGRYYHGTISGKWSFGILSSDTPSLFHPHGHKTCYACPYGNSENDDDTEFDDYLFPDNLDDSSTWDADQADFMETHGECLRQKKMCCFLEREDCLIYEFDREEHYDHVVEKLREFTEKLPGLSIHMAHYDFNDLIDCCADTFTDESGDEVSLCPITDGVYPSPIDRLLRAWPSYGQRIALLIYDYAVNVAREEGTPLVVCNTCDVLITGNPLQPVCSCCRKLVPLKFHQKTLLHDNYFSYGVYNPFEFPQEVWTAGRRYKMNGPLLCDLCNQHRFWNPLVPRSEMVIYYMENVRHNFVHLFNIWSFGEQLRQALFHEDVWIESET